MKTYHSLIAGLVLVFLAPLFLSAQTDLITPAELSKKIKAKEKMTLISVRKETDYKKAHLKNAVHVNLKKLVKEGEPKGLLKSPEAMASYFGSKGISGKGLIVIYDDGKMKYAGRAYWILKYLGAENVKIMHRDLTKWRSARLLVTKAPTKIKPVTFDLNVNKNVFVDMSWVKSHLKDPKVVFIDVRPPDEFHGTSTKPVSKGHIPGAKNMEWKRVTRENGELKSKSEIQSLADGLGATADKTIILYCATSTRAGIVFFAFKNILGYPDVRVYEGAYNEWVMNNPTEK
jgi:thiosulfate/3-mercaptopyruvate sulfurtransferase